MAAGVFQLSASRRRGADTMGLKRTTMLAAAATAAVLTGATAAQAAAPAGTPHATLANDYGTIPWMVHYDQATDYFCGPATVAEISATVPGASKAGLNQYDVAAYMGTNADIGTIYTGLVNGLNHYVA